MTKSTEPKKKNDIGTMTYEIGYRLPATLFRAGKERKWTVLSSRELLRSLHNIKDKAVEEHTRNNLQTLIDQIYGMDLDV